MVHEETTDAPDDRQIWSLYNQRSEVFFNKRKLKNSNVMITEKSLDVLGRKSCWSIDGRILTKLGDDKIEIRGWTPNGEIITMISQCQYPRNANTIH